MVGLDGFNALFDHMDDDGLTAFGPHLKALYRDTQQAFKYIESWLTVTVGDITFHLRDAVKAMEQDAIAERTQTTRGILMLSHDEIEKIANLIAKKILAARPQIGRWLTIEEAMAYAKVKSKNTLRRWIHEGYIDANKRTGHWIVDRESIDDWYSSDL